uniref:NADH-ubiquinone oxidoreductase chain 1 n=1 Tax=Clavelina oblonga TaxID=286222 RepID=A0A024FSA6_9ASCI|nr:NADH dehydrogenase subunit 1 [Clavelina oblonga]CAL24391.1 NADH dehydrogenase subunit 1 [Clavelina oblonga]
MLFILFLLLSLSLLLLVALLVLVERNILGLLQIRKGPNMVGIYGILQTVMDGIKLLLKQYILKSTYGLFFFIFSPVLSLGLALLNWVVIPMPAVLVSNNYSVLFTLFISSVMVYTIVWAGWGSSSIYSLVGSIRAVAQMISYEVVIGFFFLFFLMYFKSFNWEGFFIFNQGSYNIFFFFLFFLWFIIMLAELNRTPFDLVEGESELVGGFNVEYSGAGFTLLFLSEYVNIWFMCSITYVIFFGLGVSFFLIFFFIFILVLMVVFLRGTLPRYKFTDLIFLTWIILMPFVVFILMIGTGL